MKVSEVMTRDVRVANPEQSIREAAKMMAESAMAVAAPDESPIWRAELTKPCSVGAARDRACAVTRG